MPKYKPEGFPKAHPAQVAAWIAAAAGVLAGGLWTVYTYFNPPRPSQVLPAEHPAGIVQLTSAVGDWLGAPPDVISVFGSADWCQFEMQLSAARLTMLIDRIGNLARSDLSFVYNEQTHTRGCRSGLPPNTRKELSKSSYVLDGNLLRVEYSDTLQNPPVVVATLEGSFEEGATPLLFRGRLLIVRTDQPAAIFDWRVEQAVVLEKHK